MTLIVQHTEGLANVPLFVDVEQFGGLRSHRGGVIDVALVAPGTRGAMPVRFVTAAAGAQIVNVVAGRELLPGAAAPPPLPPPPTAVPGGRRTPARLAALRGLVDSGRLSAEGAHRLAPDGVVDDRVWEAICELLAESAC